MKALLLPLFTSDAFFERCETVFNRNRRNNENHEPPAIPGLHYGNDWAASVADIWRR